MFEKYEPSETQLEATDRLRMSVEESRRSVDDFFNGFPGVVIMVCTVIVTIALLLQCASR